MNILLIEPYDTGSHARWLRGYQSQSCHNVEILSLDGQFWQWRMLGGAVTLAEQFLQRPAVPDLRQHVAQFDWQILAPQYDATLAAVCRSK